ncbi:hypothetical protein [uncultured Lacinutrix sp.]|uniref:hypothetical protein n=1 Tax=uncultured Lacinutrix sp. TaxID=574032 RepID=UPI00262E7F5C|nr:hypothetical protein [uncultured Lacinutrix sp.]
MNKKLWWKNHYAEECLVFGICCILCSFYFFAPTLFTFKNALISKSGEIKEVETYYVQVSSSNGIYDVKSIKAELQFYISGQPQLYSLKKNIGIESRYEMYEDIKKALSNSNAVKVWIKKSESEKWNPEVFQIEKNDGIILFDINDAKYELYFLFPFLMVLGTFSSSIYLKHKYPEKFKKYIGI